ncbi:MAG: hypothetical protein OHK0039_08460 [Bacteroidia bacterium]
MLTANDLVSLIKKNGGNLLDKIDIEDIRTYLRLKARLTREDVSQEASFQELFRTHYRVQGVGVSKNFLQTLFTHLESVKNEEVFDFRLASRALFGDRPKRNISSTQFAFLTKMANLVNPVYPIYDNYVADFLEFDKPNQTHHSARERLNAYLEFYGYLTQVYDDIISEDLLHDAMIVFKILLKRYHNDEFPELSLPSVKKMDFLIEAAAEMQKRLITA